MSHFIFAMPNHHSSDWLNVRLVIWILGGLGALSIAGGMTLIAFNCTVPDAVWLIGTNAVTAVATMLTQGRTGGQRAADSPSGTPADPISTNIENTRADPVPMVTAGESEAES